MLLLVAHHRLVIVVASRGHGRSTLSPQRFGYQLTASDAVALLDRLGIGKVDLVAWSDGGIAGLDLAMRHLERFDQPVVFGAIRS